MTTSTANSSIREQISFKIMNPERQIFTIIFSIIENKLQILISEKSSLSTSYKTALEIKNFQEINKFFRQFDTIEEIYEFILTLENPEEKIKIEIENKFADVEIKLPNMSKLKENNMRLKIPQIELKENDLIVKLCQEIKKIDILESKINFLFYCTGKTEKEFYAYEDFMANFNKFKIGESKIISIEDFMVVSTGIKEKLNKSIKGINLLYRASEDGDSSNDFHYNCDGKKNTVTFVKSSNGKKFGGFASEGWNTNGNYINDKNAFIFSLDNQECYYCNNNNNCYTLFCSSSYGPVWGYNNNYRNYDLLINSNCLSNNSSITVQCSFNYKGRNSSLSGLSNFKVEDYETYELILG